MDEIKVVGSIATQFGADVDDGITGAIVLSGKLRIENGRVTEFILDGEYEIQDHGRIFCTPKVESFRAEG